MKFYSLVFMELQRMSMTCYKLALWSVIEKLENFFQTEAPNDSDWPS